MHSRYLPTTLDGKLTRVIEECAEVTKVICKIQRFGMTPGQVDGVTYDNHADLLNEMQDLRHALDQLREVL